MLTVTLKNKKSYTSLLSPSGRKYVLKEGVPTEVYSEADLNYLKSDTTLKGFLSHSGEKTEVDILKKTTQNYDGNDIRQEVIDDNIVFNNSVVKPMSMVSFSSKERPLIKPNAGKGRVGDTFEEKRKEILESQVSRPKQNKVSVDVEDTVEIFSDGEIENDNESSFVGDEIEIVEDVKASESDDLSFDEMNFDELDEVENLDSAEDSSEEVVETVVVKKKKKKVRPE